MTKDEALKMAMEAMEITGGFDVEINAIKEALAQPEQEPVTWRYKIVDVFGRPAWTLKTPKSDTRVLESQPLYTTPPQRPSRSDIKPLTDEEIYSITGVENRDEMMHRMARNIARAIEAAHGIKVEA